MRLYLYAHFQTLFEQIFKVFLVKCCTKQRITMHYRKMSYRSTIVYRESVLPTSGGQRSQIGEFLLGNRVWRFFWLKPPRSAKHCVFFVTSYMRTTLELEILLSPVRIHQETGQIHNLTSYSTPDMHSQPLLLASDTAFRRVPLGHTDMGVFVTGSRNETKKKGTLFSQGIRR
jgi:hypothetical protein